MRIMMTIKCHYLFSKVALQGNEKKNHEMKFRDGILPNRRSRDLMGNFISNSIRYRNLKQKITNFKFPVSSIVHRVAKSSHREVIHLVTTLY